MQQYPPPWIAVLSVIYWLIGVFLTLSGLTLICLALVLTGVETDTGEAIAAAAIAGIAVVGVLSLCVGPASCAVGSGLWGLKDWAWSGALALAVLWVLGSLAWLALAAAFAPAWAAVGWPAYVMPDVALLVALFWPTIREPFFAGAPRPAVRQRDALKACCPNPSCRRPLHAGWSYCPHCLASVAAT